MCAFPVGASGNVQKMASQVCPWSRPFLDAVNPEEQPDFVASRARSSMERSASGDWAKWAAELADLARAASGTHFARLATALAVLDFSGQRLDEADFSGLTFPGEVRFEDTIFAGPAYFNACAFPGRADFRRARFARSGAWFERSRFATEVRFDGTEWNGAAEFRNTAFHGPARFGLTTFRAGAQVDGVTMADLAQPSGLQDALARSAHA